MTLILTFFTRRGVLQVSDRLVTDTAGNKVNRLANKSVVFQANDARVVVCYSGAAYVAGFPTDMWIAYRLAGRDIPKGPYRGGLHIRGDDKWRRLHDALGGLASDFDTALAAYAFPRKYAPTVSIGGWQALDHGAAKRRVWATVELDGQTGKYVFRDRFPRVDDGRRGLTATPSGWVTPADVRSLNDRLRQVDDFDGCEDELARMIQVKAEQHNAIGKDCMSVLLDDQQRKLVRTRFLPAPGAPERVALTPAFVWPGIVQPSSAIYGADHFNFDDIRIEIGRLEPLDRSGSP